MNTAIRRQLAATLVAPALGLATLLAIAPEVLAQADRGGVTVPTNRPAAGAASSRPASAISQAMRASELLERDVRNPQGKDLGKVEDVIVNLETGDIQYAVLSFGGFLGMGSKLFAFPTDAFAADATSEKLVLNVSEERLRDTPGFEKNNWPDWNTPDYRGQVDRYYGAESRNAPRAPSMAPGAASRAGADPTGARAQGQATPAGTQARGDRADMNAASRRAAASSLVRVSNLMGKDVKDLSGSDVGEIEDVMLDMAGGQVRAVVVELDDSWNVDDKLMAMPPQHLSMPMEGDNVTLIVGRDRVDTNRAFERDAWPDMSDPSMNMRTEGTAR